MEQVKDRNLKKTRFLWLRNLDNLTKARKRAARRPKGPKASLKAARAWRLKLALQQIFCTRSRWAGTFLDRGTGGPVTAVSKRQRNSPRRSKDTARVS